MKTKQERIIKDIKQTILEESIKTDPDIKFMSELIDIFYNIKEEERWLDYLSGRNNDQTV